MARQKLGVHEKFPLSKTGSNAPNAYLFTRVVFFDSLEAVVQEKASLGSVPIAGEVSNF